MTSPDMTVDQLLVCAADIAVLLLENGGEVYRVEDSVQRIFQAYDMQGCQVFAIPSLIIISIPGHQGKSRVQVRRMLSRASNLSRLSAVNNLCRTICRELPDFDQVQKSLADCRLVPVYSSPLQGLACAMVGFSFTFLFGGTVMDACGAALCSLIIFLVRYCMTTLRANSFFVHLVASLGAAMMALVLLRVGIGDNLDLMIIGALMNLVPGLAITSFMRDIIAGDVLAGLIRFVESLLTAAAIALGSGFALSLLRPVLGV